MLSFDVVIVTSGLAIFCNKFCHVQLADKVHPLLCPPVTRRLFPCWALAFARKTEWLAVRALAQCTSRFPLAFQAESKPLNLDLQVVKSLTVLGTKERFRVLIFFLLASECFS